MFAKIKAMEKEIRYLSAVDASPIVGYSAYELRMLGKKGFISVIRPGKRKMLIKLIGTALEWKEVGNVQ